MRRRRDAPGVPSRGAGRLWTPKSRLPRFGAQRIQHFVANVLALVPGVRLGFQRQDVLGDEIPDMQPKFVDIGREREIHGFARLRLRRRTPQQASYTGADGVAPADAKPRLAAEKGQLEKIEGGSYEKEKGGAVTDRNDSHLSPTPFNSYEIPNVRPSGVFASE